MDIDDPLEQPGVPSPFRHACSLLDEEDDEVTEWYFHAGTFKWQAEIDI